MSAVVFALLALARADTVRIEVPAGPVEFGASFELAVVRTAAPGALEVLDDRALAPLVVELVDVRRVQHAGVEEERLVYRARAFALEPVEIALPGAAAVRIDVASALPADAEPAAEVPFGPIGPPRSRVTPFVALALLLALAAALSAARRRRSVAPPAAGVDRSAPPPDPIDLALAELAALGDGADDAQRAAEVVAAADRVRRLVEERCGIPALESTSRELAALLASRTDAAALASLRTLLRAADGVKFALARPDASARDRALAAARAFAEGLREREEQAS